MKILHVIPSLNKGGAERICLNSCIELQNQGHEVKLVCLHTSNQYDFLTQVLDYQVVSTQINLSLWKRNRVDVRALQTVIDEFQPDIIHSHLFESEINLAFCKIPKNCKRIVHFHDNMSQMQHFSIKTLLKKSLLANYYERSLILKNLRSSTVLIGISKDTTTYIQTVLPNYKACFLLNAIDLKRFTPISNIKATKKITMIGSFVPKKGQELAIRTMYELKKRNVEVSLSLIGDGLLKQELFALVKELELEDIVKFTGLVDYPEHFLQDSSIYLHTASYEPLGLVLIEAMACGLPVVCTDGKGNRDLIQEGENGFMVEERNPKLLADKVQFLLENEEERKLMGENAHQFAQRFGIDNYVDRLLEIYK
jgi:glycosyltransferase involved in cell wall biosynthesis